MFIKLYFDVDSKVGRFDSSEKGQVNREIRAKFEFGLILIIRR